MECGSRSGNNEFQSGGLKNYGNAVSLTQILLLYMTVELFGRFFDISFFDFIVGFLNVETRF